MLSTLLANLSWVFFIIMNGFIICCVVKWMDWDVCSLAMAITLDGFCVFSIGVVGGCSSLHDVNAMNTHVMRMLLDLCMFFLSELGCLKGEVDLNGLFIFFENGLGLLSQLLFLLLYGLPCYEQLYLLWMG